MHFTQHIIQRMWQLSISFCSLNCQWWINPFTTSFFKESINCFEHSYFLNSMGIKQKFPKYLKGSFCLASDQHFSIKCFPQNTYGRKIFPKLSGLFWPLLVLIVWLNTAAWFIDFCSVSLSSPQENLVAWKKEPHQCDIMKKIVPPLW